MENVIELLLFLGMVATGIASLLRTRRATMAAANDEAVFDSLRHDLDEHLSHFLDSPRPTADLSARR